MKILVSSINFHPDHSGIALYATDLPVFLAEKGHQVTVVTGFSYYPNWVKRAEDRGRLFREETFKGIRVLRGYLFVPKRVRTLSRVLHEASFVLSAALNFARAGRQDAIVILSPPLLLCLVGVLFRFLWGAQLVLNVQDIQPDAALSLNMVRYRPLIRLLLWIEAFAYRHSTHVVTISERMRDRLLVKGVPAEKVSVCFNWIDVTSAAAGCPKGRFVARHPEAEGKFLVAYAGNLGAKQGLDTLVRIAAAMRAHRGVHFFLIGEGSDKQNLETLAKQERLENLTFLPLLEPQSYREMLTDVDVAYVGQRAGTGDVFFPSKLLGLMAMSKPILVSADLTSELASFVSETGCGVAAPAGDLSKLVAALERMVDGAEICREMGRRGRAAVTAFDREVVLGDFLSHVQTGWEPSNPNAIPAEAGELT